MSLTQPPSLSSLIHLGRAQLGEQRAEAAGRGVVAPLRAAHHCGGRVNGARAEDQLVASVGRRARLALTEHQQLVARLEHRRRFHLLDHKHAVALASERFGDSRVVLLGKARVRLFVLAHVQEAHLGVTQNFPILNSITASKHLLLNSHHWRMEGVCFSRKLGGT
eukprot:PRCOL_00003898-RA